MSSTREQVGNHIDVSGRRWVALDCTIGSAVDSYFEYLVKGSILLQNTQLMRQFQSELSISVHNTVLCTVNCCYYDTSAQIDLYTYSTLRIYCSAHLEIFNGAP